MDLIERPIFLVGAERSGTTLLRLMLDHHPKIAFNLESDYLVSQLSDDGAYPDMERYREWLKYDRVFQHSRFVIDERFDFVRLVNDFLNQKRLREGKEMVGATVHHRFGNLNLVWPRAKYIYLFRDGRDVADSVRCKGWAGNVYVAADRWLEAETEWDGLRHRLSADDWIEVRYEELINDTKPQLVRICAFLRVPYSERMFDYVRTSNYGAPDVRFCYRWKSAMRKVDVQRIEEKLGDRLLRRGYGLSHYPRISLPALTRRFLQVHSRVNSFRFRLRKYGAILTLQEIVTRRWGLAHMHRDATRRIASIDDARLM